MVLPNKFLNRINQRNIHNIPNQPTQPSEKSTWRYEAVTSLDKFKFLHFSYKPRNYRNKGKSNTHKHLQSLLTILEKEKNKSCGNDVIMPTRLLRASLWPMLGSFNKIEFLKSLPSAAWGVWMDIKWVTEISRYPKVIYGAHKPIYAWA